MIVDLIGINIRCIIVFKLIFFNFFAFLKRLEFFIFINCKLLIKMHSFALVSNQITLLSRLFIFAILIINFFFFFIFHLVFELSANRFFLNGCSSNINDICILTSLFSNFLIFFIYSFDFVCVFRIFSFLSNRSWNFLIHDSFFDIGHFFSFNRQIRLWNLVTFKFMIDNVLWLL